VGQEDPHDQSEHSASDERQYERPKMRIPLTRDVGRLDPATKTEIERLNEIRMAIVEAMTMWTARKRSRRTKNNGMATRTIRSQTGTMSPRLAWLARGKPTRFARSGQAASLRSLRASGFAGW
jgi:hypothetical protein